MKRSVGTSSGAPASESAVGSRSAKAKSPSERCAGSIIDGQATMPGTRTPPSHVEPFAQRNGV